VRGANPDGLTLGLCARPWGASHKTLRSLPPRTANSGRERGAGGAWKPAHAGNEYRTTWKKNARAGDDHTARAGLSQDTVIDDR